MSRTARTAGSALAVSALLGALVAVLLALAPAERAVPAGSDGAVGRTPDGGRGQEEPDGAARVEIGSLGSRSASTTDGLAPARREDGSTTEVADAAIPPSRPTVAPAQTVGGALEATQEARPADPGVTEIGEPLVIEDVTEIGEPLVIEDSTEIGAPLVIEYFTEIGEPLVIERAEIAHVAVAETPGHVDVDDPHVHVDLRVAVPEPLPDPELAPPSR